MLCLLLHKNQEHLLFKKTSGTKAGFYADLQQELKEPRRVTNLVAEVVQDWISRLVCDCPELNAIARESIIPWLLGKDLERFELLNSFELTLAQQAIVYPWHILQQRYLRVSPHLAYHRLTTYQLSKFFPSIDN